MHVSPIALIIPENRSSFDPDDAVTALGPDFEGFDLSIRHNPVNTFLLLEREHKEYLLGSSQSSWTTIGQKVFTDIILWLAHEVHIVICVFIENEVHWNMPLLKAACCALHSSK